MNMSLAAHPTFVFGVFLSCGTIALVACFFCVAYRARPRAQVLCDSPRIHDALVGKHKVTIVSDHNPIGETFPSSCT